MPIPTLVIMNYEVRAITVQKAGAGGIRIRVLEREVEMHRVGERVHAGVGARTDE